MQACFLVRHQPNSLNHLVRLFSNLTRYWWGREATSEGNGFAAGSHLKAPKVLGNSQQTNLVLARCYSLGQALHVYYLTSFVNNLMMSLLLFLAWMQKPKPREVILPTYSQSLCHVNEDWFLTKVPGLIWKMVTVSSIS